MSDQNPSSAAAATNADTAASTSDVKILENHLGDANYKEWVEQAEEEMWQEYSDDTAYFDRLESLEYWDDEDEMYENLATQYEVRLVSKGAFVKNSVGGKKGKLNKAEAKTEAIKAAGGVVEGKGRGRADVVVEDDFVPSSSAATAVTPSVPLHSSPTLAAPSYSPPARAKDSANLFNPKLILQIVRELDQKYAHIIKSQQYSRVIPTEIPASDLKVLVAGYDHMMRTLDMPRYYQKYGGRERNTDPSDTDNYLRGGQRVDLRFGDTVPNYFANVGGELMYQRKAYSIAGLRNLLKHGATIYSQLASLHFFFPKAIEGPLDLMRTYTGNVVDLDTVVLRASSSTTVNMINAANKAKGLPTYSSSHEFGNSEQAKEMATHLATVALDGFQQALKLTDAQMKARAGHPSQINKSKLIPQSYDNRTRGHVPLWRYQNCGVDSFHANCPELEDVVGALLRAPLHCVKHYAYLFSGVYGKWEDGALVEDDRWDQVAADEAAAEGDAHGKKHHKRPNNGNGRQSPAFTNVPDPLAKKLDAFFEDCVADSCFNRKWRAIEEFGEMLEHEGTMTNVLQLLQVRHQKELMAFYDALDAEEEDAAEAEDEKGEDTAKAAAVEVKEEVKSSAVAEAADAPDNEAKEVAPSPSSAEAAPPAPIKPRNKVLVASKLRVDPPASTTSADDSAFPANSSAISDPPKLAKEIDFIYGLVLAEGGLTGRDEKTGNVRSITRGDVAAVVRAANAV